MILVDTSIWVDHLRVSDARLVGLLEANAVLTHPCVVGELALGNLRDRGEMLALLGALPCAIAADDHEILRLVELHHLWGTGIGYVDVQLLAATRLTPDAKLWTRDRRLAAATTRLGLASEAG